MSFTRLQEQVVSKSLKNIRSSDARFLREMLISVSNESAWFKEYLFRALNKGLTFSYSQRKKSAASYVLKENKILIGKSYFDKSLPSHILREIFRLILRHEITHAIDYQSITSSDESLSIQAESRVRFYQETINLIYNNLACIDRNYQINANALDELSSFLLQPSNISHQITINGAKTYEKFMSSKTAMSYFGSIVDTHIESPYKRTDFTRYVFDIWRMEDSIVTLHTLNPVFVSDRYNATKLFRDSSIQDREKLQGIEKFFNDRFDRKPYKMWEQLTSKQRDILDMLYTIRTRMHSNLGHDSICFPKFNLCLDRQKDDCFKELLACQEKVDQDSWAISNLEISAVLRERADAHLIDLDAIDRLCVDSTKSNSIRSNSKGSTYTIQVGLQSAVHSFVSESTKAFMQDRKYNHINLTQLLISMALLYCINLFNEKDDNTSMLSFLLLFLKFGLSQFLPQNPKTECLMTGFLIAPQILTSGSQAVGDFAIGSAGSYIGTTLARSMSSALGWKNRISLNKAHNSLIDQVKPIVQVYREKFNPFFEAIERRNYSQALRRACTSTDPMAFELVKILISFKNILSININETAGKDNFSALHYAANAGNQLIYDFLIQNAADITLLDVAGFTAEKRIAQSIQRKKTA